MGVSALIHCYFIVFFAGFHPTFFSKIGHNPVVLRRGTRGRALNYLYAPATAFSAWYNQCGDISSICRELIKPSESI